MTLKRHVDLCSGIGGFALGFEWAGLSTPVLFCDIEPWSRKVLRKHWPDVPIAEDVKELANDPDGLVPDCDIITAGYPCQPFSLAGERRGAEDDRHIWPEIFAIVKAKRPAWTVFENVYGHITMGIDEVLSDLEGEGYAARPLVVPACAIDAPHRRDRVWIIARNVGNTVSSRQHKINRGKPTQEPTHGCEAVAYPISAGSEAWDSDRLENDNGSCGNQAQSEGSSSTKHVAHTKCIRWEGERSERNSQGQARLRSRETRWEKGRWEPEPSVGRVANGIPKRVDRLRGLGNAIVPQIAMRIGQTIKEVS